MLPIFFGLSSIGTEKGAPSQEYPVRSRNVPLLISLVEGIMESYRRSALELAPDFSLRQLFALAQWIRHAECRRRHLSALGEQLARAPGAAAVHVRVVVGRRTLLVADDQHVVRAITPDLLQALGHAVI